MFFRKEQTEQSINFSALLIQHLQSILERYARMSGPDDVLGVRKFLRDETIRQTSSGVEARMLLTNIFQQIFSTGPGTGGFISEYNLKVT